MTDVSVVICTHNPRPDYLGRVLDALKAQILPKERWELLVIDNVSLQPLAVSTDLTWHPHGRVIREDEVGLTQARLRGIAEAKGDLLVWVDDDNLLAPDYLTECLRIAAEYNFLGSWGGQVIPEFEVRPSEEIRPYLRYVLIREFDAIKWSNLVNFHETSPCGAGMCLRRPAAEEYVSLLATDPRRKELDRKGELIFVGGDSDMALCARRIRLGMGIFPTLKLIHLIPETRLRESFFLKAAFGGGYSFTLLDYLHGLQTEPRTASLVRRIALRLRLMLRPQLERRLAAEQQKGESLAWQRIEKWKGQAEGN